MLTRRRRLVRSVALVLVAALAGPANAAPPTEPGQPGCSGEGECPQTAVQWYARGIELAAAEDFLAAADAFLQSYALKPTPEALFNAALAYERGARPVEAILTYRRQLDDPAADSERRAAAEAAIANLLDEVALIKGVRVDPKRPIAELRIAGELRSLDDFPLPLMPGEIEVEVVDEAGERGRERYTLAAGDSLVLDLRALLPPLVIEVEPEPEPPQPDVVVEPDEPPEELRRRARRAAALRTSAWVGLGTTAAAGVTLGVVGGLTGAAARDWEAATCTEYPGGMCPEGFDPVAPEVAERFERLRPITNAMIGVTAGLALGTLVLGIVAIRATRAERAARVQVRLRAGGLQLLF